MHSWKEGPEDAPFCHIRWGSKSVHLIIGSQLKSVVASWAVDHGVLRLYRSFQDHSELSHNYTSTRFISMRSAENCNTSKISCYVRSTQNKTKHDKMSAVVTLWVSNTKCKPLHHHEFNWLVNVTPHLLYQLQPAIVDRYIPNNLLKIHVNNNTGLSHFLVRKWVLPTCTDCECGNVSAMIHKNTI